MTVVSGQEGRKMAHQVHQSGSISAWTPPEWCTTCTNQRRFRPRNSKNGAPHAPIRVVFGLEASRMVHHVRQ
jgi:hypothetical protein